ncbi:hydroxymethylglutaryl-CoA reductase, degradative family protein [Reticulomyxa filosa]|uniref:3-hydroxy-3-methylglutaryl coenzyme A reductase n=1 Tax=Reticulomyxa filosa TaxID=46433 RepID=X6LIV2_RETFI|nr:hydroxymethylglutaryl-CoA reductase, degradative family protein [Reticulomyxa filosa]|eukprot:ETO01082.1 hydroxymethylglutaryl-CoA reductase, degradative family protein [Reticulomyxa filosa]
MNSKIIVFTTVFLIAVCEKSDIEISLTKSGSIWKGLEISSTIEAQGQKNVDLSKWSGYHQKSMEERYEVLSDYLKSKVSQRDLEMDSATANEMIENCIGVLGLPIGIVPTLVMNNKHYVVPLATEEPSIIAACSSICKLISSSATHKGFVAVSTDKNVMIGQIQLLVQDPLETIPKVVHFIHDKRQEYVDTANAHFCESMHKRGGGVVDLVCKIIEPKAMTEKRSPYLCVHVYMDVCEAMGANAINHVCENLSDLIFADLSTTDFGSRVRVGIRILSNLSIYRRSKAAFRIPLRNLAWKGADGKEVASKILDAYHFACDDVFRACTHNKGVMNGIDSVCIALGQDYRAIEASAHAFASLKDRDRAYQPMTHYTIDEKTQELVGELELPVAVGTKGGSLQTHPGYRFTHQLLGNPSAKTIGEILCCIGLAQNFGALRALATEGIQAGHMRLQARNIALAAKVPIPNLSSCVNFMISKNSFDTKTALEFLAQKQSKHTPVATTTTITTTTTTVCTPQHTNCLDKIDEIIFLANSFFFLKKKKEQLNFLKYEAMQYVFVTIFLSKKKKENGNLERFS